MNVLMMVSWYEKYREEVPSTSFHYTQAVGLKKYCNVVIYYPYDRFVKNSVEVHLEGEIKVFRSKYNLNKKISNRINMLLAMKKITSEFKPDLIHGQVATEAGRFANMLGRLYKIPVMITEHSSPDYSGVTSFPHKLYADVVYRNSKYNACVSDFVTQRLSTIFPHCKFHTIYNAIDTDIVICKDKDYRVRDSVNLCLVAGHYDKDIKGIPMMIDVMEMLVSHEYQVVLHLVGDGGYSDYFKELVTKKGLSCCIFHGNKTKQEVYDIVSQMDFLVSASNIESFGCSIAEAVVLGKPVIATRCGGPESIVNEQNGLLVPPNDPNAMYDAIVSMVNKFAAYNSEEISQNAIERFGVDTISLKYYRIYRKVLEQYKKKPKCNI